MAGHLTVVASRRIGPLATALAGVLGALLLWTCGPRSVDQAASPPARAYVHDAQGAASATGAPDPLAEALAEREQRAAQRLSHFREHGFVEVSPAPSDPQLRALDPDLVGRADGALLRQIQSTALRDDQLEQAAEIVRRTELAALRVRLINALVRRRGPAAEAIWMDLFDQLGEADREHLVRAIAPRPLDSRVTEWLFEVLDAPDVAASVKEAALGKLALSLSTFRSANPEQGIPAWLNPTWRGRLRERYAALSTRPSGTP